MKETYGVVIFAKSYDYARIIWMTCSKKWDLLLNRIVGFIHASVLLYGFRFVSGSPTSNFKFIKVILYFLTYLLLVRKDFMLPYKR